MITVRSGALGFVVAVFATPSLASDLSYTFIDFQAISNKTALTGVQSPVPAQTVAISSDEGDGISIAGSVSLGTRFFLAGKFQTSIVDVSGIVTNPLGTTAVSDNFDLLQSRVAFGYQRELSENFDIVFELSYDSSEYDFGSFAGENFDMHSTGAGASVGFRWNPRVPFELFGSAHHNPVGKGDLQALEFESETRMRLGAVWYFLEDLGLGVDYEAGDVDTLSISMRFSFGDLRLQRSNTDISQDR
jgi:hypothetical protein